jgi:glc operon protein GlcG
MDRNGSGTFDFALQKAAAVAAWGFPTSGMEEGAREVPGFARAPHVVTVPGGVPIWSADGKTRLGGVGVSGEAPADDAACAEVGIRAAGLRSSRLR